MQHRVGMVGEGDVAGPILLAVHHLLLRPAGCVVQADAIICVGCDHQIILAMEIQGVDGADVVLAARPLQISLLIVLLSCTHRHNTQQMKFPICPSHGGLHERMLVS